MLIGSVGLLAVAAVIMIVVLLKAVAGTRSPARRWQPTRRAARMPPT